jgi:hypothetical protein
MNRWLCFFYDGNANCVCLIVFNTLASTPISHEDDIREAIIEDGLSIVSPCFNGFVDVSDIANEPLGIVIDGLEMQIRTVRIK